MSDALTILSHDRLVGLADRFLTGSSGSSNDNTARSSRAESSSASSSAASTFPTLPTPDYVTAAFFSFLALARFPESIPARRILAACILAGADPFPFGPSTSAGGPPPVSAAPGLLAGGISSAAAHATLQLLQSGPKGVYEDVGCATLFAQASSALSAFSEAHDALSWTVDHAPGFRNGAISTDAKGKGVDLAGLGILHGMTPAAGPSHFNAHDSTAALIASLTPPAATDGLSASPLASTQPLTVLASPRKIDPAQAQRSQTLTSLGHLAAKGNRLAEAAASFEAALDADRWNWSAWAGLCDVGRVGGRRGVVDGGNPFDTLNRWAQHELGLHTMEEFLPDNMAGRVALLDKLVAEEAAAEIKWRDLSGGAAASSGALSQSQSHSQPSSTQAGSSSQSQGASQPKSGANGTTSQAATAAVRGRSGSAATAASSATTTTSSFARAGSRTATGTRTAAGNPGSNKRFRSAADASVASSTRSAATRNGPAFSGSAAAENRTTNRPPSSNATRTLASSRAQAGHVSTRSQSQPQPQPQSQPQVGDEGEAAHANGEGEVGAEDEPMLVDDPPAPAAASESAALVEGRQNLPIEAAPVGVVREFEKGPAVRRSTRTNTQGGAGAGGGGARARAGAAAAGAPTAAGAKRAETTATTAGVGAARGAARAGAANRTQGTSMVAAANRAPTAVGASGLSSRSTTAASSTRPGVRAPKSSSSTDSSYGGASISTVALPGRAGAPSSASAAAGRARRVAGGAGAGAGTGAVSNGVGSSHAAAAALSAASAELEGIRERKQEVEKQIAEAKAAAQQVAARWTHVDMNLVVTVRQLAEAYRTVRLYQGRQTAYLLRGVDEIARVASGSAAATEEQQVELVLNEQIYGATPFRAGIPDALLNTDHVRCLLGRAAHDSAKYAEAERHFDTLRRGLGQPTMFRSSGSVPTRHMDIYSLVLFHLNREVKLSALAQDLGMLDANAAETHIASGNAFALQREHAQAMRAFKRAALIAPGCAYAYTLAGYEAIELAQLERAVGFFRSAIRVDMRHWNAWAGLGQIFLKIGKMDWAEAHYREALSINPHHAVLKDLLGWTYESQGRWNEALVEYDAALAMSPKLAMTRLKRAELLTQLEQFEEAHEELLRVASLVPDESRVHILLAKSYMRLGNGQFADPNYGSSSGQGGDKSSSMANQQEPIAPNRYHDAIAFHLAAAIDLDPKNVRVVKAMGEGARVALKGTRRHIDASAMDSTVDSSMYAAEQSGEVFEDGPEESGMTRGTDMIEDDMASGDEENEVHGHHHHQGREVDDEEEAEEEEEDDEEVGSEDVGDSDRGEESEDDGGSIASGSSSNSDDDGDNNHNHHGRAHGHRGHGHGQGADSLDDEESENIEPRQAAGAVGDDSENSYQTSVRGARNANTSNNSNSSSMPPPSSTASGRALPAPPLPGNANANANANASTSAASISGDGSMAMSEEQSMELDSSL
ncbi:anaphase-promoting complex subunit cdc27 [Tilletia horrida]|uniref:Anaphase-promoting complex subunit cdc27 n=1 Tax=Tilletia horrida TaxID=155126 RepID=A0AAN6JMI2_9BASI|nr:anaphase-promoting complex subunit cdc27 [Tilletia horrida]